MSVLIICTYFFGKNLLANINITSPLSQKSPNSNSSDLTLSQVKSFCDSKKIPCKNITQNSDTITITLDNDSIILLSLKKDIKSQLTSLQATLSDLTIEGKQFKVLDFRFEKPFITL